MPQPTKIPVAFADSGDKNTIPQSTVTPGLASWSIGFPPITSTPFANGGLAPKRADFNGIFNALSANAVWQQQGGIFAYDNATDYEVGNLVVYSGELYVCLVSNGPNSTVKDPTDTTVWAQVLISSKGIALTGGLPFVAADSTSTYLRILNFDYSGGASLYIYGKDHSEGGAFKLHAFDGVNRGSLVGTPSGSLTWGAKEVFTEGNCPVSSVTNPVPYSYKTKLANGVMIQAYYGQPTTDSSSHFTWIYDEAFLEDPFVTFATAKYNQVINLHSWNKTRTVVNVCNNSGTAVGSNVGIELDIIALGRWK